MQPLPLSNVSLVCVCRGDNFLFCADGRVKLVDFGFSRSLALPVFTVDGGRGAVLWRAPELHRDPARANTPAADMWSVGLVLYELAVGRLAYSTPSGLVPNWQEMVRDGISPEAIMPLPACTPPALATVIRACLQADPAVRPTASAAYAVLSAALSRDVLHARCVHPPFATVTAPDRLLVSGTGVALLNLAGSEVASGASASGPFVLEGVAAGASACEARATQAVAVTSVTVTADRVFAAAKVGDARGLVQLLQSGCSHAERDEVRSVCCPVLVVFGIGKAVVIAYTS
jgi:hypothetical protein